MNLSRLLLLSQEKPPGYELLSSDKASEHPMLLKKKMKTTGFLLKTAVTWVKMD